MLGTSSPPPGRGGGRLLITQRVRTRSAGLSSGWPRRATARPGRDRSRGRATAGFTASLCECRSLAPWACASRMTGENARQHSARYAHRVVRHQHVVALGQARLSTAALVLTQERRIALVLGTRKVMVDMGRPDARSHLQLAVGPTEGSGGGASHISKRVSQISGARGMRPCGEVGEPGRRAEEK